MPKLEEIDVPDLPRGYVPLEVVAVIKCLDDQGNSTIAVRTSEGIMAWEAIGMLIAASDMCRTDLQLDLTSGDIIDDEEERE